MRGGDRLLRHESIATGVQPRVQRGGTGEGDDVERGARSRKRERFFSLAAVALIGLSATACTVASLSPSPVVIGSAQVSPATSPSNPAETATPSGNATGTPGLTTSTDTPAPTDTPQQEPSNSPAPPLPTGPLPSVGPAPTGTWTGLDWIAIPGGHAPAVPPANADSVGPNATLGGWSKGYVEFVWDPSKRTLTPWVSAEGLRWQVGARLDTSTWTAEFAQYDARNPGTDVDPLFHDACAFEIGNFQEGPSSILLVGDVTCGGGCGGPWTTSGATWTSRDGLAWTALDTARVFGGKGVGPISGGSSGYIALSRAGSAELWVSSDGQAWDQETLPAEALGAGNSVSDPVSMAGGFVLPGVVVVRKGHQTSGSSMGGCVAGPGATDQSLYQGAIWWSPDGKTWTRDTINGVPSSYGPVYMTVTRIDDHTVVADEQIMATDGSGPIVEAQWGSGDGRTWARLKGQPVSAYAPGNVVAGHLRGLVTRYQGNPIQNRPAFSVIDPSFNLVLLKESGSAPWIDDWHMALGPTGLLVTADGSRFWMGVPTV